MTKIKEFLGGLPHAAVAIWSQLAVLLITGSIVAGAAFASALFIGREHAQAEYRWIERFGGGLRANMPWWGGFDPKVWSAGSLGDVLLPVLAVCTMAVVA